MEKYKINKSFIINKEKNENSETDYIAFNMDDGHILVLNDTCYEIFNLFTDGVEKKVVYSILKEKYNDMTDDESQVVEEVIDSMIEKGMLEIMHGVQDE